MSIPLSASENITKRCKVFSIKRVDGKLGAFQNFRFNQVQFGSASHRVAVNQKAMAAGGMRLVYRMTDFAQEAEEFVAKRLIDTLYATREDMMCFLENTEIARAHVTSFLDACKKKADIGFGLTVKHLEDLGIFTVEPLLQGPIVKKQILFFLENSPAILEAIARTKKAAADAARSNKNRAARE